MVYCPNTGSMAGLLTPGNMVCISRSANPKRKYPHTLEMIMVNDNWVGINTGLTNTLVREALVKGVITELGALDEITAEVRVSARSRLDFLARQGEKKIYIEVKNCTMVENGTAMFPDAVTSRGVKHIRELTALRQQGHGAVMIFCVQRRDAEVFRPAFHIDPLYGRTLAEAAESGVVIIVCQAEVGPAAICVVRTLPFQLEEPK